MQKYWLSPEFDLRNQTEARSACKAMGRDLASPYSPDENKRIREFIPKNVSRTYLGLIYDDLEENWRTVEGALIEYSNCAANAPENTNDEGTNCATMAAGNAEWLDADCSEKYRYICGAKSFKPEGAKATMRSTVGYSTEFRNMISKMMGSLFG